MGLCLGVAVKEREVSKMIPRVTARMMILLIETGKRRNLILVVGSRSQSQIIYLMSFEFSLGT